jgi:hypothetical protein
MLVDRAPEPMLPACNANDNLVEGLCRELWMRTERGPFRPKSLRSQDVELLGEGEL